MKTSVEICVEKRTVFSPLPVIHCAVGNKTGHPSRYPSQNSCRRLPTVLKSAGEVRRNSPPFANETESHTENALIVRALPLKEKMRLSSLKRTRKIRELMVLDNFIPTSMCPSVGAISLHRVTVDAFPPAVFAFTTGCVHARWVFCPGAFQRKQNLSADKFPMKKYDKFCQEKKTNPPTAAHVASFRWSRTPP